MNDVLAKGKQPLFSCDSVAFLVCLVVRIWFSPNFANLSEAFARNHFAR